MTLPTARRIGIALIVLGIAQTAWGQRMVGPGAAPPPQDRRQAPAGMNPPVQGPPVAPQQSNQYGPPAGPQYGPQPPQQMPVRQASRQQVPLPGKHPNAPFQLTREQDVDLRNVLRAWEERGAGVKTLSCTFRRWDYDPVFRVDPQTKEPIPTESIGELKYSSPDKGLYHITEIREFAGVDGGERKFQTRTEGGEHWVCDGQSIWQFDSKKKQLIERHLPPDMQGKAICDGPLPFLFGAQADKLLDRYWMRVITPAKLLQVQVWIEAYPKHIADAANFRRATVILDRATLLPQAIEVQLPEGDGKARHVHEFANNVVNANGLLNIFKGDFAKPTLPRGWTKVEEPTRPAPAGNTQRG